MKSTIESLSPPETSKGRGAESNCVAVRRGGEQLEADPQSQTPVNPIRPVTAASLLGNGEACRKSGDRSDQHPSSRAKDRAVVGGWGENVGKVSCGRIESCPGRNPREWSRTEVSLSAVASGEGGSRHTSASKPWEIQRRKDRDHGTKPANHRWSKGRQEGGKAAAMNREEPSVSVPAGDKQTEEDLWQRHRAERGVWSKPMLVALERGLKGTKWLSLIDKVWSERTLELAWGKVKSNAGACGVDGITIGRFAKDSQNRLLAVKEPMKRGTWQPKSVKRVWMEKPGSADKRPLGIPTVTDRVVQAAVRRVIEPILMVQSGFEMVRYADDMVVLCRSQKEAAAALSKLKEWMESAGLSLHPEKTRVVDMNPADSHFDFLGHRFKRSRRGRLILLVRPKSLRKLRETIKPKTRRNNGQSLEAIVADLNRTLKSWYGYFKHVHPSELGEIDQWLRMRLRSILRKRRGGRGRGRGQDHHRWPNRYFTGLRLFCLLDAKAAETTSLRQGANH